MNHTQGITPLLVVRGAARASDFYVEAFSVAEELPVEDFRRRRDAPVARFAAGATRVDAESTTSAPGGSSSSVPRGRGAIHLVVGPVGAGKSTFATRLAADLGGVRFTLDDWMTRLFAPDRPERDVVPWYVERAQRCVDVIVTLAADVADRGGVAILEIGLLRREQRDRVHAALAARGHVAVVHVLDAPREVRRARVERRNRERGETFSMVVPLEVFEMASDLWEPLGEEEPGYRIITTLA